MRRENEFQIELTEVVNQGKIKGQGEGALRIEREREEKERRIRRELWEGRSNLRSNSRERGGNNSRNGSTERNSSLSMSESRSSNHSRSGSRERNNNPLKSEPIGEEVQEKGVMKRVVSEGFTDAGSAIVDDSIARSQSHSSGLLRVKALSGGAAKRFSGDWSRKMGSSHDNNIEEEGVDDKNIG